MPDETVKKADERDSESFLAKDILDSRDKEDNYRNSSPSIIANVVVLIAIMAIFAGLIILYIALFRK